MNVLPISPACMSLLSQLLETRESFSSRVQLPWTSKVVFQLTVIPVLHFKVMANDGWKLTAEILLSMEAFLDTFLDGKKDDSRVNL